VPLPAPSIDNRRYQDLLNEALARIPVHTPEWTNFGPADPGVTLIEVFAFLTESLLYRANQIPERNRSKFIDLLGVPLSPAASARGLVAIANESREFQTLQAGLEMRAGQIPFFTENGLDVLPLEAKLYLKRPYADKTGERKRHYDMLYASLRQEQPAADTQLVLYETAAWSGGDASPVNLADDTVDGCLWLALLIPRASDSQPDKALERKHVREQIAGKTLSLGIVPALDENARRLQPKGSNDEATQVPLVFEMPRLPAGGKLPQEPQPRVAEYRPLEFRTQVNVLEKPGVVELPLPSAPELELWQDLDPLEAGSGSFPPALDDTALADRVVTWIRISARGARARLLWVGINAASVLQREPVMSEVLSDGTGEPDQVRQIAHPPVLAESVRVYVGTPDGKLEEWTRVDDLLTAPPEVQSAYAPRQPRAELASLDRDSANVFAVDPESGKLSFGDGLRGRRPPAGAKMRVSYDRSHGLAGNVARGAINTSSVLAPGLKVTNPVPTWGGAPSEDIAEAQKQIPRFIQHRDRLVTAADFEAITLRTPGVQIGRVEVQPAFNPDLAPDALGNSPGTVTLMLVPEKDPVHPEAPEPDSLFMGTVCSYLDARRLVTTELILRGPDYRDIWIAVGIELLATGGSGSEVRDAVRRRIREFLAPVRRSGLGGTDLMTNPDSADAQKGWPLRRAVSAAELMAEATRVPGVRFVRKVRLAGTDGIEVAEIPMHSLQLPRIAGLAVVVGDAPDPASLMGGVVQEITGDNLPSRHVVPVPVIPDRC
jgi:hypothetical protein